MKISILNHSELVVLWSFNFTHSLSPVNSSVPIWLNGNIDCDFSDTTILSCDHDAVGTGVAFCTHSDDLWLNCSTCDKFLCNDGTCVTACDGTRDCAGGEDEDNIACSKYSFLKLSCGFIWFGIQ